MLVLVYYMCIYIYIIGVVFDDGEILEEKAVAAATIWGQKTGKQDSDEVPNEGHLTTKLMFLIVQLALVLQRDDGHIFSTAQALELHLMRMVPTWFAPVNLPPLSLLVGTHRNRTLSFRTLYIPSEHVASHVKMVSQHRPVPTITNPQDRF